MRHKMLDKLTNDILRTVPEAVLSPVQLPEMSTETLRLCRLLSVDLKQDQQRLFIFCVDFTIMLNTPRFNGIFDNLIRYITVSV